MDFFEIVNKGLLLFYFYMSMYGGVLGMMLVVFGGFGFGVLVFLEYVFLEVFVMMNFIQINLMISGGIFECEFLEGNIVGCMLIEILQFEKL